MKYYGNIGYAVLQENVPGVYVEKIITHSYYGDVLRNIGQNQTSDKLNDDVKISNEFSIIGDPYAYENFHQMRYIEYMGIKWKITSVEVQYPRLILNAGGVYNEQTS